MPNSPQIVKATRTRLEDDITVIEEFDRFRQTADRLRRAGIKSLCSQVLRDAALERSRQKAIESPGSLEEGKESKAEEMYYWADELSEEPQDLVRPALVHLAVTREFVATTGAKDDVPAVLDATIKKLSGATIYQFFGSIPESLGSSRLDGTEPSRSNPGSHVPVFQAARVLRASLATPITVFSKQAALAYYRVIRELAAVDEGNWIFGGARATEGGVASAFMTGECARAISALARGLCKSADLLDVIVKLFLDWKRLLALDSYPYPIAEEFRNQGNGAISYLPRSWAKVEANRLAFCAYNEITSAALHCGAVLEAEHYRILCDTDNVRAIPDFCSAFAKKFREAADRAVKGIRDAKAEVDEYHQKELEKNKKAVEKARLEFGHAMARSSLIEAGNRASEAKEAAEKFEEFIASKDARPEKPREITTFIEGLNKQAERTRKLLSTTTIYVESVLAREIERATSGQFVAGELIAAAAAYAELKRPELDRRLEHATEILCRNIAMDGSFATTTALDTNPHGYTAVVIGSENLRSFAQLLQRNDFEVESETIKRMLSYFERTAVHTPRGELIGWTGDQPRYPVRAMRWTTALAILALDRITRMLDDRINQRVFRHFSVKGRTDFEGKPPLKDLFYSDYGIAAHGPTTNDGRDKGSITLLGRIWSHVPRIARPTDHAASGHSPDDGRYHGSIAYLLERMRSHLLGLAPPPGHEERCYSLLLFGPPGTGKTQLIESLATSADTHFVEITPSDFLVEGEAYLERQARNIFKCLSFLTRTVILFDEFDPMIQARALRPDSSKLDAFAFLTPGMLPKLKLLNERAKRRQVAY